PYDLLGYGHHPGTGGDISQLRFRGVLRRGPDFATNFQHFVEPHASFRGVETAGGTPGAFPQPGHMLGENLKSLQIDGRGTLGFRADGAVLAYQTLTNDADQCSRNDTAVQSQIANSEERRNRISGVDG